MNAPIPTPPVGHTPPSLYRVGTLTYTKMSLAMLFFWLLWGDFCYNVMEAVTPSLIPVKFLALGAGNWEISIILGIIPTTLYTVLNPIISFKSDRYRSRWGRRIPFILFTLPFLVLSLVSLAFSADIGFWLHSHLGSLVAGIPPNEVAIYTIGFLLVVYTFFNTFLTSVFWYLFNDVVPEHLLARFMSWFRIISLGAGAFYNFCIFKYADTHFTVILLGAAILYFVGFGAMCYFVKEGEYPPPPPYIEGKTGVGAAIRTYANECHTAPLYWYQWIGNVLGSIGGAAGNIGGGAITAFALIFYINLGMTKAEIGDLFGSLGLVVGGLILISGWLADRYHPIRVVLAGAILGQFVVAPANMIWIFWHPTSHTVVFWTVWIINMGLAAPALALNGVYDPPLMMRLFPRERYGQFCSVNAIWRSIGGIAGGFIAPVFLNFMVDQVGKEKAYFYIPVWQFLFGLPCFVLLFRLYYAWKKHGGDEAYVAPILNTSKSMAYPANLTTPIEDPRTLEPNDRR